MRTLTARQIRSFKSSSVTREDGSRASASILGHTHNTAISHYNRSSEAESQLQLSGLISDVAKISILQSRDREYRKLSPGGSCVKPQHEVEMAVESDELGLLAPNCRTTTGCWICPHFAVHANTEDLWKLQSYLYVLNELRLNSLSPEIVADVHAPIVRRLTDICARVLEVKPQLEIALKSIKRKVRDGNIHPIYEDLIRTYEEVGAL